jgi:hypothetical protein
MKNYLDLLAINANLIVITDGTETLYQLFDTIVLDSTKPTTINGYEILPKYQYLAHDGILTIPGPFYSWLHEHSGQGWLLRPLTFAA